MNLANIIHNHHWLSIKQILCRIDSEQRHFMDEYKRVFLELKELELEESPIILIIERHWEEGEPTIYAHSYGFDPRIPKTDPTQYVALEWTSWSKWLGFEIHPDAIDEWTELEIISHCMLEMTLDGFTQNEISKTRNQIISKVNSLQSKYLDIKFDNE